jgi:hypothetical protein
MLQPYPRSFCVKSCLISLIFFSKAWISMAVRMYLRVSASRQRSQMARLCSYWSDNWLVAFWHRRQGICTRSCRSIKI